MAAQLVEPAMKGILSAAPAAGPIRLLVGTQLMLLVLTILVLETPGTLPLRLQGLLLAGWVLGAMDGAGAHLVLLALCLLTLVLSQLISNAATVLIVAPIAVSIAGTLDLSVMPFMMALTVAGAAAFLTPIATPANLMVMEPGGYRFGDYWRMGLPLEILVVAVSVPMILLVWPLH